MVERVLTNLARQQGASVPGVPCAFSCRMNCLSCPAKHATSWMRARAPRVHIMLLQVKRVPGHQIHQWLKRNHRAQAPSIASDTVECGQSFLPSVFSGKGCLRRRASASLSVHAKPIMQNSPTHFEWDSPWDLPLAFATRSTRQPAACRDPVCGNPSPHIPTPYTDTTRSQS